MISSDRKKVYEADQLLLEGSVLFLWEITDFPQALKCCSIQPDPQGWSRAEIHEKSPGQLQLHLFLRGINCFTQLYLPKGLHYFRAPFQTENSQGRSLGDVMRLPLLGNAEVPLAHWQLSLSSLWFWDSAGIKSKRENKGSFLIRSFIACFNILYIDFRKHFLKYLKCSCKLFMAVRVWPGILLFCTF